MHWFFEGSDVNASYLAHTEKRLDTIHQVFAYQPDAVLAPSNSIPSFLPGLKVAVFHGFDAGKQDSKGHNDHFKIRGCFDLYCTQGPNTTSPFKALQKQYGFFNVIETGWSALDPLFEPTEQKEKPEKPVILFCSTFSKRLSCAQLLYPYIEQLSKTGRWQWVVQFHPKMAPEVIEQYKTIQSQHLSYIETDDVIPLLKRADAMLCDTSSVINMFLLQNKPVVTYKNFKPGPHLIDINSPDNLEQSIEIALSRPQSLMKKISFFINETHPYKDGMSAHRVVNSIDEVLAGKHPLNQKRPLNFFRDLKFRKRLNFWKL